MEINGTGSLGEINVVPSLRGAKPSPSSEYDVIVELSVRTRGLSIQACITRGELFIR